MASKKNEERAGDAVASAQAFAQSLVRFGELCLRLERIRDRLEEDDVYLIAIRVRLATYDDSTYLAVVSARTPDGRVVGFAGGDSFMEAVRTVLSMLENKSIKWKVDRYEK